MAISLGPGSCMCQRGMVIAVTKRAHCQPTIGMRLPVTNGALRAQTQTTESFGTIYFI